MCRSTVARRLWEGRASNLVKVGVVIASELGSFEEDVVEDKMHGSHSVANNVCGCSSQKDCHCQHLYNYYTSLFNCLLAQTIIAALCFSLSACLIATIMLVEFLTLGNSLLLTITTSFSITE